MNKDRFLIAMGNRIAEGRRNMQLSQEEFSELADISPQMLSTAERGIKAPRPENLIKISEVLQVSVDYLLTGYRSEKDQQIIMQHIKQLSPKQANIIEKIVEECIELSNIKNKSE